jgi:hypothetical protein
VLAEEGVGVVALEAGEGVVDVAVVRLVGADGQDQVPHGGVGPARRPGRWKPSDLRCQTEEEEEGRGEREREEEKVMRMRVRERESERERMKLEGSERES